MPLHDLIFAWYMLITAVLAIPTSIIGCTILEGLVKASVITSKTSDNWFAPIAIMGILFPLAGIFVPLVLLGIAINYFFKYGSDLVAYLISRSFASKG